MQSSLAAIPIILLLTSCALLPQAQSENVSSLTQIHQPPNESGNGALADELQAVDIQWSMITSDNAESQCILQAKAEASSQGYPPLFVSGCSCEEEGDDAVKAYDCTISAIDGPHQVAITCIKEEARCLIVSEIGSAYYTFEELEAMVG